MPPTYTRKHPTTGYWLFYCNTQLWRGDEWLALGERELWYKVSDHHAGEFEAGQKAVLRINKRLSQRGERSLEVGIYALFEVSGPAEFRADPDHRHYGDRTRLPEPMWRAPLRVVANLLQRPILATSLPASQEFGPIHKGQQTASIAIAPAVYRHIEALALGPRDTLLDTGQAADVLADFPEGVRILESRAVADPVQSSRISRYIERGSLGRKIKAERKGRCQFCEALGLGVIGFATKRGEPYAEAHHVVPVSKLVPGSLGRANIVVLCANHHRQAHFGHCDVTDRGDYWIFTIDDRPVKIIKPFVGLAAG